MSEPKLTTADYDSAMRIREIVRTHLPWCDKAGNCGLNVDGERETLLMMDQFAQNVLSQFFPNGRPQ